jgi:predicted enzyme related to lactoylglutathione lyase
MPPMDVMTQGRMAMIGDPSGAVLGLWQPMEHQGAEVLGEPGSVAWNELQTRDLVHATAFYATLFDWAWNDYDGSGYLVGNLEAKEDDDKSVAGAMTMPDGVPAEAPSMWLVYFAVGSCDEAVEQAAALGATVFLPPMTMGPGRFAGLTDPAGGMFMVGHFEEQEPA